MRCSVRVVTSADTHDRCVRQCERLSDDKSLEGPSFISASEGPDRKMTELFPGLRTLWRK